MSLSSMQLDAFFEISRLKSFTAASKSLAITQSALSQRIDNLEGELGTPLFIREPSGIRLTTVGEELLRYCKNRKDLEHECVSRIRNFRSTLMSGLVRIGAYSTVMRSIVIPSVSDFLRTHPSIRIEMTTKELRDLPIALRSSEVDFIFFDRPLKKDKVENLLLGHEEYILIESKLIKTSRDVYLDHDIEDETTSRFFDIQRKRPEIINRSFLDDIYGIIDMVALGLGKAVVPLHLVQKDKRIRRVTGLEPLFTPVYLCYFRQPVYTELQKALLHLLENKPKELLYQK